MDKIQQARAFHETHKMKIERDYRLEFLKLSKEDIYDFLETKYGDYIHVWRQKLSEAEDSVKILKEEIARLKPIQEIKGDEERSVWEELCRKNCPQPLPKGMTYKEWQVEFAVSIIAMNNEEIKLLRKTIADKK